MTTTTKPRIYVACLASYNAGELHGEWIDIEGMDRVDIYAAIDKMLAESPAEVAEEWAIHDYEGIPSSFGEHPSIDALADYVAGLTEHGEAWEAYVDLVGIHHATVEGFEDAYQGEYESAVAYVEDWIEQCCDMKNVPDVIKNHIDYEAIAYDFECNDVSFVDVGGGRVFVFHNH